MISKARASVALPGPEIRAFVAWRRAGGPYGRLVFAAPFFGRLIGPPGPRSRRAAEARLAPILPGPIAPDETIYLDLDPRLTLAAVPYLRRLTGRIIPLIARWPADPAVLPAAPVLSLLVGHAPKPADRRSSAGPPVFLLDGARAGPPTGVSPRLLARHFDNRYAYQIDYLPPAAGLLATGLRRITWISEAGAAAPDLAAYERRLIAAGLAIDHRSATEAT